jgi:hypothetical protein
MGGTRVKQALPASSEQGEAAMRPNLYVFILLALFALLLRRIRRNGRPRLSRKAKRRLQEIAAARRKSEIEMPYVQN